MPKNRVRRTKAQWKGILEEYATCGLTQATFCQKHHIANSSLCKWLYYFASQPLVSDFIDITESLALAELIRKHSANSGIPHKHLLVL